MSGAVSTDTDGYTFFFAGAALDWVWQAQCQQLIYQTNGANATPMAPTYTESSDQILTVTRFFLAGAVPAGAPRQREEPGVEVPTDPDGCTFVL